MMMSQAQQIKAEMAQKFQARLDAHRAKLATPVLLGQGYILVVADAPELVMVLRMDGSTELVARPAAADLCGVPHYSRQTAEMLASKDQRIKTMHVNQWHRYMAAHLEILITSME